MASLVDRWQERLMPIANNGSLLHFGIPLLGPCRLLWPGHSLS